MQTTSSNFPGRRMWGQSSVAGEFSPDLSPQTAPDASSLSSSGGFGMLPPSVLWSPPVQAQSSTLKAGVCKLVRPNTFEPEHHYYPRVLNAQIHPLVASFMQLGNERIIARFCHLNPGVSVDVLRSLLFMQCRYFRWADQCSTCIMPAAAPSGVMGLGRPRGLGSDLFNVTTADGKRQMICIETNSCPSGQKSMPWPTDQVVDGGYRLILEQGFAESVRQQPSHLGGLAVIYDKNGMEASGYAAAMADLFNEDVHLVEFYENDPDPPARFIDSLLHVRTPEGGRCRSQIPGHLYLISNTFLLCFQAGKYCAELSRTNSKSLGPGLVMSLHQDPYRARWDLVDVRPGPTDWVAIRAAFRYVTQRPWNRIPIESRTVIFNPIITCLAGGRNKGMAAKAYEELNRQLTGSRLSIRVPETRYDVPAASIPGIVRSMGGHAVVKVPYANAGKGLYADLTFCSLYGQGVFTITRPSELDELMATAQRYDNLVVQNLVGNNTWSSSTANGTFYHVGTVPDKRLRTFVADLRMMVCSTPEGFVPVAMYARRSRKPLQDRPDENPEVSTWDMLGTNLSVKDSHGNWTTETNRLLLMDRRDYNQLGLGLDDLIDAYIQTVLSVIAIDLMCQRLMPNGHFDMSNFSLLNPDLALLREILHF